MPVTMTINLIPYAPYTLSTLYPSPSYSIHDKVLLQCESSLWTVLSSWHWEHGEKRLWARWKLVQWGKWWVTHLCWGGFWGHWGESPGRGLGSRPSSGSSEELGEHPGLRRSAAESAACNPAGIHFSYPMSITSIKCTSSDHDGDTVTSPCEDTPYRSWCKDKATGN